MSVIAQLPRTPATAGAERAPAHVEWLPREHLLDAVRAAVEATEVVLDVGCGLRPQAFFHPRVHLCCEPHDEYAQELSRWPDLTVLRATAEQLLPLLPDRSVDSIFLLDVIEHLEKDAGQAVIRQCERLARRQIVLFTPLGFVPQDYDDEDAVDGWGLHGGAWQAHRSGWAPEDFDSSWSILACRDYHATNGKGEPRDPPDGAFFAIKTFTPGPRELARKQQPFVALLADEPSWNRPDFRRLVEAIQASLERQQWELLLWSAGDSATSCIREAGRLPALASTAPYRVVRAAHRAEPRPWLPRLVRGPLRYWRRVQAQATGLVRELHGTACKAIVAPGSDLYGLPAAATAARILRVTLLAWIDADFERTLRTAAGGVLARRLYSRAIRQARLCFRPATGVSPQSVVGELQKLISPLPADCRAQQPPAGASARASSDA
jgi:hypothetical protein